MRSVEQVGIGMVVPHDMALDRELWRWAPEDVSLHLTRTPNHDGEVDTGMIASISAPEVLAAATKDLLATEAPVYAYACTSGSFVRGASGELALVDAMVTAGAPTAVTTSGAMAAARSEERRVGGACRARMEQRGATPWSP